MVLKKIKVFTAITVAVIFILSQIVLPQDSAYAETPCWNDGTIAYTTGGSDGGPPTDPNPSDAQEDAEPVNLLNGSFNYETPDFSIPLRGLSIIFKRHYNSLDMYDGPFGYGWNHSYNVVLVKTQDADGTYVLKRSPDGTKEVFTEITPGVYEPPLGTYDALTEDTLGFTLREKDGIVYKFDTDGRLTSITDRNQNSLTLSYDYLGLLTSVADDLGRYISFSYNAQNKIESIQDHTGRTFRYTYDQVLNLASVITPSTDDHPSGTAATYAYDDKHQLTTITDANGDEYLYNHYDDNERVDWQRYNGGTISLTYDTENLITHVTDGLGNTTIWHLNEDGTASSKTIGDYTATYEYNVHRERTRITYPKGNSIEYTYDTIGNITQIRRIPPEGSTEGPIITSFTYEPNLSFIKTITDPRGNTTTYDYDTKGNLLTITYPTTGAVTPQTNFTYNEYGHVDMATDPNNITTKYEYHPDTGYLERIINAYGTAIQTETQMTYDALGNVITITDPRGNATNFTYNALNQLTETTSPAPFNYTTEYTYDANGNLIQIDRETGDPSISLQTTTYTYTVLDKVETITDNLGNTTVFDYDANGNRVSIQDAELNTTYYEYDERNLLWNVTDAIGNITEYTYEENGNLSQISDANENLTTYTYDDFDRLSLTTYADGTTEGYSYDPASNLTEKRTRKNDAISYVYDEVNRLTEKRTPEGTISYAYDEGSRLETVTDSNGTISYTYDQLNRVKAVSYPGDKSISYQYDTNGNRTRLTYPDDSYITYTYDELNRLTNIKDTQDQPIAHYVYDALSRRTGASYLNGTSASYTYDSINRLTELTNNYSPTPATHSYTYDAVGNRLTYSSLRGSEATEAIYTYDDIYQLTNVTHPDTTTTYNYDPLGNRTSTANGATTTYTSNSLNQYTSVGGITYTYDNNGNLTSDPTNTYTYDSENRLISATTPAHSATYTYDPFGRRIQKNVDGVVTNFIHDGGQIIAEYDGAGSLLQAYVYGAGIDECLVMKNAGGAYYYHYDGVDSVVALTDSGGNLTEEYEYDIFGNIIGSLSDVYNPYYFTGRRYDSETGLYYYRSRYYNPERGRFLQADPLGYVAGINLYRYCRNNPVNFADPWGLIPPPKVEGGYKAGDVVLRGKQGGPIERITNSPYSHTGIVGTDGRVHQSPYKSQSVEEFYADATDGAVVRPNVPEKGRRKAGKWATDNQGKIPFDVVSDQRDLETTNCAEYAEASYVRGAGEEPGLPPAEPVAGSRGRTVRKPKDWVAAGDAEVYTSEEGNVKCKK